MTIDYRRAPVGHLWAEFDTGVWEEFSLEMTTQGHNQLEHPTPLAKQYASMESCAGGGTLVRDIMSRTGFMFCKVCPSCKLLSSKPVFLDVQCHFMQLYDSGFNGTDFARIGDWSSVSCNRCHSISKWGKWHDEDLLPRPRETVFRHGSGCFSYRREAGPLRVVVLVAKARKSDGELIWKRNAEMTDDARSVLSKIARAFDPSVIVERILDLPYFEGVRHNDHVRTRTDAARSALASL